MGEEDKSFEATPQKLKKAKEQGQVIKSQDLSAAGFLLVMFMTLLILAGFVWEELARLFILIFDEIPNAHIEDIGWQHLLFITLRALVAVIFPFLFIAFCIAIAVNFFQVGPLFTLKPITPDINKLNPVNGFKNLFNITKLVDLAKNILKMLILGLVGFIVFAEFLPKLLVLGGAENVFAMMGVLGQLIMRFIVLVSIAFILLGGGDYLFQRWKFLKDQKMSFKEMKDEFKNNEGDPMVKAALRQRRMQMLQQSMLEAVPTADVVTTNPIHIAVALKYDIETMNAPRVVAKGTELFAERIKDIAREHGVPVVENALVARTLHKVVDVDQEIPPSLYEAVAEILMFAWRLKGEHIPLPDDPQPSGVDDSANIGQNWVYPTDPPQPDEDLPG